MESGTVRNQGRLEQVEKENKPFFYHRNVVKEKETLERLQQKPDTCRTTKERQKLTRYFSKKGEFRNRERIKCKSRPHKPLLRLVLNFVFVQFSNVLDVVFFRFV